MLTLLTFPESFGAPSHSPFCVKAMCLLELSGLDWQPEYLNDPRPMPLSRLPVLRVKDQLIPDSAHIQAFLEDRGAAFHEGMSQSDKARAHALMRLAEGPIYNDLVYDRWLDEANWTHTRHAFFGNIPWLVRGPLTRKLRKKIRAKLMSSGYAQFSESERRAQFTRDLTPFTEQLSGQDFMFGTAPTAADAAIVPFLDMILNLPVETAARDVLRNHPTLPAYVSRTRAALYPKSGTAPVAKAA